jgi:hypothetical protein
MEHSKGLKSPLDIYVEVNSQISSVMGHIFIYWIKYVGKSNCGFTSKIVLNM